MTPRKGRRAAAKFKFSYISKNDHYLGLFVCHLGSSDQHIRLTVHHLRLTDHHLKLTDHHLRLTDYHLRLTVHHLNTSGCLTTCAQGRREGGNPQLRERNAHCQAGRRLSRQSGVLKYAMLCLFLAIMERKCARSLCTIRQFLPNLILSDSCD